MTLLKKRMTDKSYQNRLMDIYLISNY